LFTYKTVAGLNAETIVARHYELKALVEHFKRFTNLETYAEDMPLENLKPTMNWTVNWEKADDAHLLIGIWRHGFGGWELMKDVSCVAGDLLGADPQDPTLHLEDKIFLEDPKSTKERDPNAPKPGVPGPIHLVRRGDYLCKR